MNRKSNAKINLIGIILAVFLFYSLFQFIKIRIVNSDIPKGKITFDSPIDGDYEIYTANTNGTYLEKLTSNSDTEKNAAIDISPVFSPTSGSIIFVSDRNGENKEFIRDSRGRKIGEKVGGGTSDIYIIDTNDKHERPLTYMEKGNGCLEFSPDGNKIIFNSHANGRVNMVMDYDGRNRKVFYVGNGAYRISPDSQRIYNTFQKDISVMDLDGSNQKRLTYFFSDEEMRSKWTGRKNIDDFCISKDGQKLAFALLESTKWGNANYVYKLDFYIMNIDGSNLNKIYTLEDRETVLVRVWEMKFSPDGGDIIFMGNFNRESLPEGIYSLNLKNKTLVNLTEGKEDYMYFKRFTFTPDGNRILFIADIGQKDELFRLGLHYLKAIAKYIVFFGRGTPFYDNVYACIMNIDGTNYKRIFKFPNGTSISQFGDFVYWAK
ncbi:MAG: hypothetical protein C4533_05265 [Candidatus Omnitrophota bacterium]|jgi:Tol biopolymer transport system component|nr:MAG: hypothetical protein C4533_05265 [Candidatus Omnitrophota bacterium]